MPRLGRYFVPDQPLHVIQRGNNREAIFFGKEDYARYRDWLTAAAAEYGCAIHAYVLMTNHVHLLVTPRAADSLPRVTAPTLLLVGERDPEVLELNRGAARLLRCPHRLIVVAGATHLFTEPGALAAVAELACDWFVEHLAVTHGE